MSNRSHLTRAENWPRQGEAGCGTLTKMLYWTKDVRNCESIHSPNPQDIASQVRPCWIILHNPGQKCSLILLPAANWPVHFTCQHTRRVKCSIQGA